MMNLAPLQTPRNDITHKTLENSGNIISQKKSNEFSKPSGRVRVVVRCRPMNTVEIDRGDYKAIRMDETDYSTMNVVSTTLGGKELIRPFAFDSCVSENISQQEFFQRSGVIALLDSSLQGYSATVFAYGQTGSGKTYSMSGLEEQIGNRHQGPQDEEPKSTAADGLMLRSIKYLFDAIQNLSASGCSNIVRASYCEIYNENVYDLLNVTSNALNVRWNDRIGFYVQDLLVVECNAINDVMAVIEEGHRNRRVSSHAMNKDSSRSHSLLTLDIESKRADPEDGHSSVKFGRMSFVDLAGSERLKDTKSSNTEETSSINKSLFTLGKVISCLSGGSSSSQGSTRQSALSANSSYVPYRDSKLTKLLMNSLGGNSLALMIACVSPSSLFIEETLSTLNYATRANNIQNKPTIQVDPKEQVISNLKQENNLLRMENAYLKQQLKQVTTPYSSIAHPHLVAPDSSNASNLPQYPSPPPPGLTPASISLGMYSKNVLPKLDLPHVRDNEPTQCVDSRRGRSPNVHRFLRPLHDVPPGLMTVENNNNHASETDGNSSYEQILVGYQNQCKRLYQEKAQMHANYNYSMETSKSVLIENEQLRKKIEHLESVFMERTQHHSVGGTVQLNYPQMDMQTSAGTKAISANFPQESDAEKLKEEVEKLKDQVKQYKKKEKDLMQALARSRHAPKP